MPLGRTLLIVTLLTGVVLLAPERTGLAGGGSVEQSARYYARGRYQEGFAALPSPRLLDPEGNLLRARLLIKLGKHKEARKTLVKLIRSLPHMRDLVRYLQAEAAFGAGDHLVAAKLFRSTARAKHSHWVDRAWRRRADALTAAGQLRAAAKEYEHLLRIYPEHPQRPQIELQRALCLLRGGLRREAGVALREVWLRRAATDAGLQAGEQLEQLRASGHRLVPPPFWRLVQRVGVLRRSKRFKEAHAALDQLARTRLSAAEAPRVERERALTRLKSGDAAGALTVLTRLYQRHKSPSLRRQLAGCRARLGQVDQAVELILGPSGLRAAGRGKGDKAELRQAAELLATYGRYAKALELQDLLARRLPRAGQQELLSTRTWLAYRAGQHERAIKGFAELALRSRRDRPRLLYWQARAAARAGRHKEAVALYQQVTEQHLRTYYGLLARSRLLEATKTTLPTVACPKIPAPTDFVEDERVGALLDRLLVRDGELYPSLRRVRTLWRLGMIEEARRELWLIGIDFAWVRARGRPQYFIHRPEAERILRGTVPPRRRFGARERAIHKERARLGPLLGELMQRGGAFYFAWRFLPPDKDPVRQRFPRAYPDLVVRTARRHGLDPNVLWAVMKTESSFRTDAVSRVGATGLMQIMPTTGRLLAAELKLTDFDHGQLYSPQTNLTMAGWYLGAVLKKFKGQLLLAAAGYNGGPHNVALWLDQRGAGSDLDEFVEEIPFSESRRYAKKILRLVALYERTYCGKDDRVQTTRLQASYEAFPGF